MVVVRTVEEFHRRNEQELRAFMSYKTGIHDRDLIDEVIQEFYVRLIRSRTLEEFDENGAADYSTWVCNLLCWLLPYMKRRNFRHRFKVHSTVPVESNNTYIDADIWDFVDRGGNQNAFYEIDGRYATDFVDQRQNDDVERFLCGFFRYIHRTESTERADQMELFVRRRLEGLTGVEIGMLTGTPNSAIHALKRAVQKKMETWRDLQRSNSLGSTE